eukprot:scaffold34279_cov76-Amphora_coffeaeformis.AAC.1
MRRNKRLTTATTIILTDTDRFDAGGFIIVILRTILSMTKQGDSRKEGTGGSTTTAATQQFAAVAHVKGAHLFSVNNGLAR